MPCLGVAGELDESQVEWKIPDFFSLSTVKGSFYVSPSFTRGTGSWRFIVFPAGNKKSESGFLSVCLENETDHTYHVTCTLSLKKSDGTLIAGGTGNNITVKSGVSIRYDNFYERQKLQESEYDLMPSGCLTIHCNLKYNQEKKQDVIKTENFNKNQAPEICKRLTDFDVLSENFRCLLDDTDTCDVVLEVEDKEFKAHKLILMARSSVFAAMFKHDTLEKQTGIVKIPDCDSESFQNFLKYLYCGELEDVSFRSAFHLYSTSNKYDIQKLKEFCINFLMESLTPDNVCDVITLADKYDETKLLSAAQDFFTENFSKIFLTSEWENLLKTDYRLANKFLIEMSKVKG